MRVFRYIYTFQFILLAIRQYTFEQGKKSHFIYFIPFYSMILTVSSFAFCFVKKRLAHSQSSSVPKTSLNSVCIVLVELAITCVHDYMVVTVKVTKIYGKINLIGGPSQLQLYQQLSNHDFRRLVTHECYIIYIYKARARRNGYRMFISVYILCYWTRSFSVIT